MIKGVELNKANGSLAAYCTKCNKKISSTTKRVQELYNSGEFGSVDSFCTFCGQKARFKVQFKNKEYGKTKVVNSDV